MIGKTQLPSESPERKPESYRLEEISRELQGLPIWVGWRREQRVNKNTGEVKEAKVPYNVRTGKRAKSNDSSTWSSFEEAKAACESGAYDGAGICLSDPYIGGDLDGCILPDGSIEPWAETFIHELNSYTEVSPSRTGVRIIVKGKLPAGRRQFEFGDRPHHGWGLYDSYGARYLTLTGWLLNGNGSIAERTKELRQVHERFFPPKATASSKAKPGTKSKAAAPGASLTDDEVIARMLAAKNSEKVWKLFGGDSSDYRSPSEADSALWTILAFWCNNDAEQIERIFRRSGLMRDKAEDRPDNYLRSGIRKAIQWTTETYRPSTAAHIVGENGEPDLIHIHFTDTGNAERLLRLHGEDLRYCYEFKSWFYWNGQRWVRDTTEHVRRLGKHTIRRFLEQAIAQDNDNARKFAHSCLDARRLHAMLSLAQPEVPISVAQFDVSDKLLNFENGTVDLSTGKLRPHQRGDYITSLVHYSYDPAASCPRWLQFVDESMGGGADASEGDLETAAELVGFLQPALGYSITGETGAKAVFLLYGIGDNGKTTLLSVIRDLVREYSATIELDVLTSREDSNNTAAARAQLLGKRFVITNEAEDGQKLSSARLKRLCQGEGGLISACRKYENPITFRETHKLWMDSNFKPELPSSDAAIWSRLHLVPFIKTVPKERQDRQLRDKLLAEAPGILRWLVEGAVRWYAKGLPPSKTVTKATREWQEEVNRLRHFLEERTEEKAGAYVWHKNLFASYKGWSEENNERHVLSARKFSEQMITMGYKKEHKEKGAAWLGIRFPANGA